MARLSEKEFEQFVETLVEVHGLGKLQQKLLQLNALVSRRRMGSAEALARQMYTLTVGLDRDGIPSRVLLALWEEFLGSKIDEEAAKNLETLADRINGCLGDRMRVDPTREGDLRQALLEYDSALSERVGNRAARLTMLNRAVPDVARLLREM